MPSLVKILSRRVSKSEASDTMLKILGADYKKRTLGHGYNVIALVYINI